MAKAYSRDNLLKFLKESAMAGLLNPATARSRRNAAEQLLEQLEPGESDDLRDLDVAALCARFHKLQGSSIRPEAMEIYRRRLEAALTDFFNWTDNPDQFVSVGGEQGSLRKRSGQRRSSRPAEDKALENIKLGMPEKPSEIMPIPLRKDLIVFIHNLPLDLSTAEAEKLSRVIKAMVTSDSENSEATP